MLLFVHGVKMRTYRVAWQGQGCDSSVDNVIEFSPMTNTNLVLYTNDISVS